MSLFIESSIFSFIIITVLLGGAAAFMSGRALALGWKSIGLLIFYMMLFGAGIRFLHFALYEEQLLSLTYYISHTAIILGAALLGYRMTRTSQMTQKYPWLYEATSPLSWRNKP